MTGAEVHIAIMGALSGFAAGIIYTMLVYKWTKSNDRS